MGKTSRRRPGRPGAYEDAYERIFGEQPEKYNKICGSIEDIPDSRIENERDTLAN